MKKALIGYQLYSAREECAKDLLGVMKQLKALGYDAVEFAGFYGHTAEEIKGMLEEAGLIAVSDHVPYAAIVANMFGRLCKEAGIQLLYHNHDFEFEKLSGMYALDFMYEATEPEVLQTEIDTCWVNYSGENPADYIRKYTGRAPIVHMKDFVGSRGGAQPYALIKADGTDDGKNSAEATFEFRPVGHGCQDVASIIEAGLAAGAGIFVVEQDQWYNRTPMEAAAMSIETLKKYL